MTLITIDSDDAFAFAIYEIPVASAICPGVDVAPESFEREAEPPEDAPLRLLVEDKWREYALPWPYVLTGGDFHAAATAPRPGMTLHESLAVRGWKPWKD